MDRRVKFSKEEKMEAKVVNIKQKDIDKNRWNVFLYELYELVLKKIQEENNNR